MGFRIVVVNRHSKLSYENNHLKYKSNSELELLHLSEIDLIICETTDILITTALLQKLVENNITTIFCDNKRLPSSFLMPYYARHDSSLAISRQIKWENDLKLCVWTEIIVQKIKNQSTFLLENGFLEKSDAINNLLTELKIGDPTNREGHSARIFFNTLYGNGFSREDDNDINASLNYGYTLVMSLVSREIVKCGCLTGLGLKHSNQFNNFNLASDLMEPLRCLVDDIVYQNKAEDFVVIKRRLLSLFSETYKYNKKDMYLTNIVGDYVKKVIQYINNEREELPSFLL